MRKIIKNAFARKGATLIIVLFLSVVALLITSTLLTVSDKTTNITVNDQFAKNSYYAAESGLARINNVYNSDLSNWNKSLSSLDLPDSESSASELTNGAKYWISAINSDINDPDIKTVEIIGKYKNAYRKIRAKINVSIPSAFDDYGLLTDGVLRIHGNKTLNMSIHGNDGLNLTGPNNMNNNAVATQSVHPNAGDPDSKSNPVGGYVTSIEVPLVPIDQYKTLAKTGINLDINQSDLNSQIIAAPAGSYIYISGNLANITKTKYLLVSNNNTDIPQIFIAKKYKDEITLYGDMQGKIIFVDGDISLHANGIKDLSNVMVISSGSLSVNGSVDISSSHTGKVDVIFASNEDITLNGSRDFKALFWTNGSFTQNGSSMAGRVIAKDGITFNGSFVLSKSDKLNDNGTFDKVASVSYRQLVTMD